MRSHSFYIASTVLILWINAVSMESAAQEPASTTQVETEGYFTLGQADNRWWFLDPDGNPFFSLGEEPDPVIFVDKSHVEGDCVENRLEFRHG